MKTFLLALLLLLTATTAALAYEQDTARDSAATGAIAAQPPYKMPPLSKALFDHMHNKLVHFPLVLTFVAAAMLIVARKKPELEPVAFWLVWIAALSVIPVYFTGKAAEEFFEGKPKEWLVEVHEKQAITIAVLQSLWVLSLLKASTRRFAWLIGLVVAFIVSTAGFIGGLIAHGH